MLDGSKLAGSVREDSRENLLLRLGRLRRCWDAAWPGVEDTTAGLIELCRDWVEPDWVMVEVGCFAGVSTEIFALHAYSVYAVDPWVSQDGYFQPEQLLAAEVRFNSMKRRYPRVRKLKKTSLEAAEMFQDGRLHAVYLDGDHRPSAVAEDLRAWLPKVRPGGLLMGHDHHMVGPILEEAGIKVEKVYSEKSWVSVVPWEVPSA